MTKGIRHFGIVKVIGGNALEMRIPLKWKVLGLHTLVLGYAPIIENELSPPLWLSCLKPECILMEEGWDIGYER